MFFLVQKNSLFLSSLLLTFKIQVTKTQLFLQWHFNSLDTDQTVLNNEPLLVYLDLQHQTLSVGYTFD